MLRFLLTRIFLIPLDIIYWLKWITTYIVIRFYKDRNLRFDLYDGNAVNHPVKLGFLIPQEEIDLESPFPESHLRQAADEVFFYGTNSKSESFVVRIARGCNQNAEAWIHLRLQNGKTYQLIQSAGYQQNYGHKCKTFSCGGLQIQCIYPMRRWRIHYCGTLMERNRNEQSQEKKIFIKFTFLWVASSKVYDATTDISTSAVVSAISRAEWKYSFLPPFQRFSETLNFYAQSGCMTGIILKDGDPQYEMYLFGEKLRYLGKSSSTVGFKFKHVMGNTPQNGLVIHFGKASSPSAYQDLHFGFVVPSNGVLKVVEDEQIISTIFSNESLKVNLDATFTAGKKYNLSGNIVSEPIIFTSNQVWSGNLELHYFEFVVQNFKGSGIILTGEFLHKPAVIDDNQLAMLPKVTPLIINFDNEVSHFPEITGGKGSSLGKLMKLSHKIETFIVPKGIIVTTSAYNKFLTSEIYEEIRNLENIAYGNIEGNVTEACKKVSSTVVKTNLPYEICNNITTHLSNLYGNRINHQKFAVRSSATGEDTEQMSAAGQMATFLGVKGLNEIFIAIKKCWASQFDYIAIEYKRRNGQILNSPMAVVIQEMVQCDVAGVLFTCDPVTNNPSVITITGNYGLGESVVSASEEPDTLLLERGSSNEVILKSIIIGSKHHKIVMQDNGGTTISEVSEKERNKCCLSKDMAEKLGNLAIKIENYYKSPRDIEWGILNGTIYILQSRPVTSGTGESDFETKHEFDSPMRCEREYFTVCNVGEVWSGATSPLGSDFSEKYFRAIHKKLVSDKERSDFLLNEYFSSGLVTFYNHKMLNVFNLISRSGESPSSIMSQGFTISFFGRLIDDPEILSIAKERLSSVSNKGLRFYIYVIMNLFYGAHDLKKVKMKLENNAVPFEKCKTSEEIFKSLMQSCSMYDEAYMKHITCTESSSLWNMLLLLTLKRAKGCFDNDVYSDFARLLSMSSNVESADVPCAMQNLAHWVVKDMTCEDFKAMSVEEAKNWLENSATTAGSKFREFIKRHGHRCLKEFDIRSIPWGMDSKPLVKLLQNLSGTCEATRTKSDDDDYSKIFSELQVPLDFISRCWIRFLLPNCRRAVGEREAGKSLLIKAFDNWRRAFTHLSKVMVSEGYLPDTDLIFFLTVHEIQDLLQTRSPRLLARARHRRKLFPVLDGYFFPEIMRGIPKPINDDDNLNEANNFIADLTMKGIPVSQGVTKSVVRVVLSLEEASYLQPGEILVTYCTDIGWSPYFPILSGVVTELGGLISHGAVVSREYGLPCVVGLHGATKQFKTGDYVLLDGNKGILQRLPKPES